MDLLNLHLICVKSLSHTTTTTLHKDRRRRRRHRRNKAVWFAIYAYLQVNEKYQRFYTFLDLLILIILFLPLIATLTFSHLCSSLPPVVSAVGNTHKHLRECKNAYVVKIVTKTRLFVRQI